jgi:hypothetical protein
MPKGQDTRHDPARKVGVREINEKFYPPAPQTSTGGGAGGQKPPKKKIAGAGGGGPGGPGGPNDPYGPQKKRDDYNNPPLNPAPNKGKDYPNKVGPVKKEQNPHEIMPRKEPAPNKDKGYPSKIGPKKEDKNPHEYGLSKPAPNKDKPARGVSKEAGKGQQPYGKEEREEKYKNGWYN